MKTLHFLVSSENTFEPAQEVCQVDIEMEN
jgi:hypothetical protein